MARGAKQTPRMDEPDGPESDEMQSLNFPAFSLTFGGRDPAQVQSQLCGVSVAHMLSCKQTRLRNDKSNMTLAATSKKKRKKERKKKREDGTPMALEFREGAGQIAKELL